MPDQRTILLVNDDPGFAQALAEQLGPSAGFAIEVASSSGAAFDRLDREPVDLLIVDLRDAAGPEFCRLLRARRIHSPVILFGDPDLRATVPAEAILAKPIRLALLIGRIEALLARREPKDGPVERIGPYLFEPAAKRLVEPDGGREIRLTEKETDVLCLLAASGDRPISRETLLDAVWGYAEGVDTHTLETHVYRLRRKIEADPAEARILVTDPIGYRLVR